MNADKRKLLIASVSIVVLVCALLLFEKLKELSHPVWWDLADAAEGQIADKQYARAEVTLAGQLPLMNSDTLDYAVAQKELAFCLFKSGDKSKFQAAFAELLQGLNTDKYDPIIIDQQFDDMASSVLTPAGMLVFVPLLKTKIDGEQHKNTTDQYQLAVRRHNLALLYFQAGNFAEGRKLMAQLALVLLHCDMRSRRPGERLQAAELLDQVGGYLKHFCDPTWQECELRANQLRGDVGQTSAR